jgi:hypothetical protein
MSPLLDLDRFCLTIFLYVSLLLWNALMHVLPIPLLQLLITHLIGLRLLQLISRDSVLWFLKHYSLPFCVRDCASPSCSSQDLVNVLLVSARNCIQSRSVSIHRKLTGWSKKAQVLKRACKVWYRVWSEAGCPSSGVLSQIKKHAKSRF